MIKKEDYIKRGWDVVPNFIGEESFSRNLLDEMECHPEAAGKSSWGTRNLLQSFVLSMRPSLVLEIGSHIGSGSLAIGAALQKNKFGMLYCLEPQDHYYELLNYFIKKGGLEDYITPLKLFSTDPSLPLILKEKVDIIFLDANHSYSHALKDLELSRDLLSNNGLIFLDDVGPEISARICTEKKGGVRQALLNFLKKNSDFNGFFLEPPFWLNPCGLAIISKQSKPPRGKILFSMKLKLFLKKYVQI
jgi:predicted O-methyltransferase YrrM